MAVIQYTSETGSTLWKAYVSVKSKVNPSIRIQRWKFGLKSQKQAEREVIVLQRDCHAEVLKRESQGSTWGSLVESWEAYLIKEQATQLSQITRGDYIAAIRKFTSSWWKRSAVEISRADVLEVITQMKAQGASVSHRRKIRIIINRIFVFGLEYRIVKGLDRSPTYGIHLERDEEKKPEILAIHEIKTLLHQAKELSHPWYPIWAMALLTGMRNGELYALLWSDVDFENREVAVTKSYNTRMRSVKSTKAGYWRTVQISDELLLLLKELKVTSGDRKELLPRAERWYHGDQAKKLREFCLGIGLPSIRFHTLRACFATQLIRNGVPPIQIQKICGWKDLETMQRYIRLAGIEIKGATESLRILPDVQVIGKAADMFLPEQCQDLG